MLNVERLDVYYGQSHILRNVNLSADPGKVVCLMGRNGVGKTTLLKSIVGLLSPSAGQIQFEDRTITRLPTYRRARLGIGYVPQGREIIPHLTVAENLRIGLEASRTRLPEEIYDLFPVLKTMLNRRGGDLSGGQQQQLAIGRALAADPKLLILDEPTEGIQPNVIQDIENVLLKLRESGRLTVVIVEQYLEFALRLADHYYMMARGSIVASGEIKTLTQDLVNAHLTV